ncbi:Chemotaxis protein [Vibrio chagasii]|uniref:methyl-accepting chemotaxis protein n=1 Tax=Vibrio TaxID=662 RepID=UPI000769CEEB|nr:MULTISPECIES: methyl-accepting chemotaxis protein [Vibrio]MCG9565607.1 methyl-accepting chemotaxis protein [Vibrio chagasii]NOI40261.1 methyl-accepting chemotaxis protein [Vibrio sp. 070316B]NOI85618.1 methyl-accepting chemotaxis protein [Vibrio sp. 99K-1]NOI97670.1 methyl-accepting chemotaxis protein [Vibrio sp. T3Y01]PQJ50986.1 chemotaxis protein [Vibrio splendidus]
MGVSSISIKNKLTLMFVVIIFAMTMIQTYITGKQLLNETYRSIQQYSTTLTEANVSGIEKWIEGRINVVNAAKDAFKYTDDPKSYFTQSTNAGRFQIAYAGLSDGRFLQGVDLPVPEGYDPRTRDWYKVPMSTGKTVVTEPYVDVATNDLVVTIASPFNTNGYSGVIGADLNLNTLINDVVSIEQPGVYAFLVDGNGKIVAHRDRDLTLKSVANVSQNLSANKIKSLSQDPGFEEMSIDGAESLLSAKKVPHTDWYFTVVIDKSQSFASYRSLLRQSAIFGLIQLAVIAFVAMFVIKKALAPLTTLSSAMEALSKGDGDLTQRITVNSKDEIGTLAHHVNAFIAKLQEIVRDIADSSSQLNEQSEVSTNVARQTSDGLTVQLHEISQIATAVHEMSATAEEVANNAQMTADSAISSTENCEQGKRVIIRNQDSITNLAQQVENASGIIQELEKNALDINAILSTISDIAEQTNLLALNAAIEAARAGEQGRGFAVVADEVRVLSQRTHSSTDEIREMIETLQKNSVSAVESMQRSQDLAQSSVDDANNATTALEEIATSIQQISDMASHISNAASEQRTVTGEVSKNIQLVNDVSDKMSTEADNSRHLSEELRGIAQQLNTQVQLFKY